MRLDYLVTKNFKYNYSLLFNNLFLIYIYNTLSRSYLSKNYINYKNKSLYTIYLTKSSIFSNDTRLINLYNYNKLEYSVNKKYFKHMNVLYIKYFQSYWLKLILFLY